MAVEAVTVGIQDHPLSDVTDGRIPEVCQDAHQQGIEVYDFINPSLCPWLTRRRYRVGSIGVALACALLVLALVVARTSCGWLFVSCLALLLLVQDVVHVPRKFWHATFAGLIFASALYTIYCFVRLCVAYTSHAAAELVGILMLLVTACFHIIVWQPKGVVSHAHPRRRCSMCCGWSSMLATSCLTAFTLLDAVWGLYAIVAIGPDTWTYVQEGPRLNYWCQGAMQMNTIIVLEAGWMGPSPYFDWYMKGLSAFTRTCSYDAAGMGWSSQQDGYGFRHDAKGIQAVLAAEFDAVGLSGNERIAIVGGHSRGWVVASTFENMYVAHYKKVILLDLDGSGCTAREWSGPPKTMFMFGFILGAPASGLARFAFLVSAHLRNTVLSGGEIHEPDVQNVWRLAERILGVSLGGFLQSGLDRMDAWVNDYDGPVGCCTCEYHTMTGSPRMFAMAYDICLEDAADRWTCAGHTTMIVASKFANVVVARILSFLHRTLNASSI